MLIVWFGNSEQVEPSVPYVVGKGGQSMASMWLVRGR